MRKSVKVGLVGFLLGSLVVAGIAAGLWQAFGLGFVERRIAEALIGQGVPVTAVTLRSVGTGRAVLTDMRFDLAGGIAIERVEADYRLADLLWDRRVDRLVLFGLRVDVAAAEAGAPMAVQGAAPRWPEAGLPVGSISVREGRIAISTPVGEIGVTVDVEARALADGAVELSGQTRIRGGAGAVGTPFTGGIARDGGFTLTATPESGNLGWGGSVLESPEGTITIAGTFAALALIDAALAADIVLPDGSSARLDLRGRLAGDRGTIELGLASATGQGRIDLSGNVTNWDGPSPAFDLAIEGEMPLLEPLAGLAGSVDADWMSTGAFKAGLSGLWDRSPRPGGVPVAGRLSVEADVADAEFEERLSVAFAADLRADVGTIRLMSAEEAQFTWLGNAASDPLALTLGADAGDPFELTLGAGSDGWSLTAAGPFRADDGWRDLSGIVDASASGGESGTADRIVADIASPQAVLRLADEAVALDGVSLSLEASAADPALRIVLDSATVRSLKTPAMIVPLQVSGGAVLGADELLAFDATVRGAAGAVMARATGRHDLAAGAGSADIRLDPVSFAPGVRQPADIAPALAADLEAEVTGSISGSARIDWRETLSSSGELRVEGLTLTHQGAAVRNIEGVLMADSLFPLNLPDGQLLAIGGADLGLVLEEGAIAFGLAGDRLSVQGIGFSLADGSLAVEPFRIGAKDREARMVVTMQGVDLGLLSAQFPVEGLTVTGHLDGEVPIRLFDDTISIDNGVLETTEPGVIRYIATLPVGSAAEGGVGLLIGAVRNFQYQGLRATLNGRTGDDLQIAVRLTGANPDLYDGYPIALNINLSGDLEQVLRSGLNSMAIADDAGSLLRGE